MYAYTVLSLICLVSAGMMFADSYADPEERLLVNSKDPYSMNLAQRESLVVNGMNLIKDRYLFGWGTSSYTALTAFMQDSDFGDDPWLSPKSDLLQKIIENGIAGLVLHMLTPLMFLLLWLFRRRFSLPGTLMLLTVLCVAATGIIDFPFQSPAVMLGIWVLMMSAFRWDNAKVV